MITETDDIAKAIDEAAGHWPALAGARGRLLLRLIEEGYQAIRAGRREQAAQRRAAVERTSGALTGAYESDYLERLREDWPA
jgi:hypothetical protein